MSRKQFRSVWVKALTFALALFLLIPVHAVYADDPQPEEAQVEEAEEPAIPITLSDSGIESDAPGVYAENSVLTITLPGKYLLQGSLSNGQIVVNCEAEGKVRLVLGGVSIHCEYGPALNVINCSPRLSIDLMEETVNELSDGAVYADENLNGSIYSKSDLTITGSGVLNVKGNYKDGVVSKDDLRIKGGVITVEAVRTGIRGKDCVEIYDGEITVIAGKDGIKTTNDEPEWGYISMEGGTVNITCGDDPLKFIHGMSFTGGSIVVSIVDPLQPEVAEEPVLFLQ